MNKEDINELLEYNNEYMEAQISEEIFGGDHTSAVELKYVKQELERYKNIIDELEKWLTLQRDNLDKRVSEMETDDKNMTRANHYIFIYNRVIDKLKELKGE